MTMSPRFIERPTISLADSRGGRSGLFASSIGAVVRDLEALRLGLDDVEGTA